MGFVAVGVYYCLRIFTQDSLLSRLVMSCCCFCFFHQSFIESLCTCACFTSLALALFFLFEPGLNVFNKKGEERGGTYIYQNTDTEINSRLYSTR